MSDLVVAQLSQAAQAAYGGASGVAHFVVDLLEQEPRSVRLRNRVARVLEVDLATLPPVQHRVEVVGQLALEESG